MRMEFLNEVILAMMDNEREGYKNKCIFQTVLFTTGSKRGLGKMSYGNQSGRCCAFLLTGVMGRDGLTAGYVFLSAGVRWEG